MTTPGSSNVIIEMDAGVAPPVYDEEKENQESQENQSLVLQFATILIILLYDYFSFSFFVLQHKILWRTICKYT